MRWPTLLKPVVCRVRPWPQEPTVRVWFRSPVAAWCGHDAITIGRTIHVAGDELTPDLFAHEYCHVMDAWRFGRLGFWWRYVVETLRRRSYARNSYEVAARTFAERAAHLFPRVTAAECAAAPEPIHPVAAGSRRLP